MILPIWLIRQVTLCIAPPPPPLPPTTTTTTPMQGGCRSSSRTLVTTTSLNILNVFYKGRQPGNSDEQEMLPEFDYRSLKDPKYLKEMLAKVDSPSSKAKIYLEYLSNCQFNRNLEPTSIIYFSQEDVTTLASIEEDPDGAREVGKNYISKEKLIPFNKINNC